MSSGQNIAIFDLDYTLTKRGTWGRFVWSIVRRKPWLWVPLLAAAGWMQLLYKIGKSPRIRVKQAMMRWSMVGMGQDELLQYAESFVAREVTHGLRPGGIEAVKRHKAQGDILIIISAAVDIIVKPVAEKLGFNHWLATNMKWEDGRLASEFAERNC